MFFASTTIQRSVPLYLIEGSSSGHHWFRQLSAGRIFKSRLLRPANAFNGMNQPAEPVTSTRLFFELFASDTQGEGGFKFLFKAPHNKCPRHMPV